MAVSQPILEQKLLDFFPNAVIDIKDLVGDENHYEITVRSQKFHGLSKIAQHKLVYEALGDMVGNQLHALSLKTFPE